MYFIYKGRPSTDFGMTISKQAPYVKSAVRTQDLDIAGMDGILIEEQGYLSYILNFDVIVEGHENLDAIFGWLQGEGDFARSDYPDRVIHVEMQSSLDFVMLFPGIYTCAMSIYVKNPLWRKAEDVFVSPTYIKDTSLTGRYDKLKEYEIENTGTAHARPIIKLTKGSTDSVDVTINDSRFVYTFADKETEVVIDCETHEVKNGHLLRHRNLIIGYKYPKLNPGKNKVYVYGDAKLEFKRKERWL